jgi:hypothetical protein
MFIEEYEAIRLSDFDHCNHQEASDLMGVSRPTFTRIYAKALEKVARAFVEGRTIIIQGGHVYFDSSWFICRDCNARFTNPAEGAVPLVCPLCSKSHIEQALPDQLPENKLTQLSESGCDGLNHCKA